MGGLLPLAVTMGDPAGAGPQATWGAWGRREAGQRPFYLIGDPDVAKAAKAAAGVDGALIAISNAGEAADAFARGLPIMPMHCEGEPSPGNPHVDTAGAIIEWIERAVDDVQDGRAAGIVTNPISKALLYKAGFTHPGHTEFLAALAAVDGVTPRPVMMLVGGGLRVALATIHVPLGQVGSLLTTDSIVEVGEITAVAMARDFGIAAPRIALCGVNPHAGEDGALGREEIEIVNPAAERLRAAGIDASDARPGDTVFHEMLGGAYDAVIAMYHDQGLIPVKTLDMWNGVNVTLGLPFVRTSPDHGTAYEAARSGKVRCDALVAAIKVADQMATARAGNP